MFRRISRIVGAAVAAYVLLATALLSFGWITQPELGTDPSREGVLRTFGEDGPYERRLAVLEDADGTLWVVSVQHVRRWYQRALENPDVELDRAGETRRYRAVPVPEAAERIDGIVRERAGGAYWGMRATWMFAPFKPLRLNPR